ncbi:MAG: hypothetical protein OXU23_26935 [Candidatus Poribacteria bacterium]|nr:hypothetical protein [Candidatus Poribacteria bacterium]
MGIPMTRTIGRSITFTERARAVIVNAGIRGKSVSRIHRNATSLGEKQEASIVGQGNTANKLTQLYLQAGIRLGICLSFFNTLHCQHKIISS